MTTGSPIGTALVGIDDSDHSRAALEWACRAVGPAGTVHAVHATTRASHDAGALRRRLDGWIASFENAPTIVTSDDQAGDPSDLLLGAAERAGADVIVVGVHDRWRRTPRRLGHTVSDVIQRTTRPVVIVGANPIAPTATPTGTDAGSGSSGEPRSVVVGVGEGSATRSALRWATAYAHARALGLELVRALPSRPVFGSDGVLDVMAYYIDRDLARAWALEDIESLADEIRRSDGIEVPVTMSAPRGSTGPTLVESSQGAAVLVLGLHDTDAAEHEVPLWLHHAVTHAPCPVVLVPVPSPG